MRALARIASRFSLVGILLGSCVPLTITKQAKTIWSHTMKQSKHFTAKDRQQIEGWAIIKLAPAD